MISPDTDNYYHRERGQKKAVRYCTRKPMEDMIDKCSVLKGWTSRKHVCENDGCTSAEELVVICSIGRHWPRSRVPEKINRTCDIQGQDCGNTSAEWHARDGLRAGAVCDGAKTLEMTSMLLKSVSETQWHGNRSLEVKRFLKLIMSWQRKPRNERRKGTGRLDRHQWNVENVAEHTSRIELGVMLASLTEVAQTRMRYESGKRLARGRSRLRVFVEPITGECW